MFAKLPTPLCNGVLLKNVLVNVDQYSSFSLWVIEHITLHKVTKEQWEISSMSSYTQVTKFCNLPCFSHGIARMRTFKTYQSCHIHVLIKMNMIAMRKSMFCAEKKGNLRATSRLSQGLCPYNCEGFNSHWKAIPIIWVPWFWHGIPKLASKLPLGSGHVAMFTNLPCRNPCRLFIHKTFFRPLGNSHSSVKWYFMVMTFFAHKQC